MTATLRERAEHAAKYQHHLVVPARDIKQLLDERDQAEEWADQQSYPLVMRQGEILTGVALALNGPPPPLTSWSHHDLAEKAEALVAAVEAVRAIHEDDSGRCTGCNAVGYCEDSVPWPCPTLTALDGGTALAEGGDER